MEGARRLGIFIRDICWLRIEFVFVWAQNEFVDNPDQDFELENSITALSQPACGSKVGRDPSEILERLLP